MNKIILEMITDGRKISDLTDKEIKDLYSTKDYTVSIEMALDKEVLKRISNVR